MTTKNLAFLPPFLKLEWAKQHIDELDARPKAFGIYRVGIYSDKDPLNDFVRIQVTQRPPFEVNLALGDALYNLRAAGFGEYIELMALSWRYCLGPGVGVDCVRMGPSL